MASSLRQKVRITTLKNKKTGKSTTIAVAQKTGYLNLTINGTHFYYNKTASYPMSTKNAVSKTVAPKTTTAKKTIVITRRK